jgi:hypothetical protein
MFGQKVGGVHGAHTRRYRCCVRGHDPRLARAAVADSKPETRCVSTDERPCAPRARMSTHVPRMLARRWPRCCLTSRCWSPTTASWTCTCVYRLRTACVPLVHRLLAAACSGPPRCPALRPVHPRTVHRAPRTAHRADQRAAACVAREQRDVDRASRQRAGRRGGPEAGW